MSLILNIESATDVCSICISKGEEIIAFQETTEQYAHAEKITQLIESCVQEATIKLIDIDAIAISQGPGSYTGLRVGSSTAKGICYALDKPLIAVDTLQAIALATKRLTNADALFCPMIDARRMEVYTALYDAQIHVLFDTQALIVTADSFQKHFDVDQRIIFSGNGAPKTHDVINSYLATYENVVCSSKHLVPLAHQAFLAKDFVDIAYFSPHYFKAPNITKPKKIL